MAAPSNSSQKKPAKQKKAVTKKASAAEQKPAAKKKKRAPARKRAAAKKVSVRKSGAKKKASAGQASEAYGRDAWNKKPAASGVVSEQPMMKTLRAEHRHIASVMQLFSEQLQAIDAGEAVDAHVVFEVMEYMATWPDRYHHPREDLIYSLVAELDAKAAEDVDTLQRDHDHSAKQGRQLLKDIELWRQGDINGSVIVKRGREYISHTYEHMNVEEKVVFPHIESVLTLQDWRELAEDDELRAVSITVFGPSVQREFRSLARRLRRGVRRRVERGAVMEWVGIEAVMESLEVLSMAYDSARSSAESHWRTAIDDSKGLFEESLVTAPLRCSLNNLKLGYNLLGEVVEISREVFDDLEKVNEERKERMGLLKR